MIIDLQTLSQSIKDQLPLSLQLQTDPIDIINLPLNIQHLILNSTHTQFVSELYRPINIIDGDFVISPYNDFTISTSKRSAIIGYIKNYLLTPKGSYPFDPEFGNNLKRHLQTRDTSLREVLLTAEMKAIVNTIRDSFSLDIQILGSTLTPFNSLDRTEYQLDIRFRIADQIVSFGVG